MAAVVTPPARGDWRGMLADREQRALEAFEQRHGQFGGRERRHGVPFVVERVADSGDPEVAFTIRGYAAVYNRKSLDLGGFVEIVEPGFFDEVLARDPDAHALWDHSTMLALARTRSAKYPLELKPEDRGLRYFAKVAPTSFAADLRILMEGGVIDQSSFAFTVEEDSWEIVNRGKTTEYVLRRLIRCGELYDVTICAQGAYPSTDSEVMRTAAVAFARSTGRLNPDAEEALPPVDDPTETEPKDDEEREAPEPEKASTPDAAKRQTLDVDRPITDPADLRVAIHEMYGVPGRDLDRADLITRAHDLKVPGLIPALWRADGTLADERVWGTAEKRETYKDLYEGLEAAVDDALVINGAFYYCWVRDFDTENVYFSAGGDLYAATYTIEAGGPITLGDPVKVRPVTEYVETERAAPEAEARDWKAEARQRRMDIEESKRAYHRLGHKVT